nr:alpha/beta hydrolase [uncultured Clostridium sp.]
MAYKEYKIENGVYNLLGDGTCLRDIQYSEHSEKNTLDLYTPTLKKDSYPLVVFIHGGAFIKGDKSRHLAGVLHCLERGYAVASINYRLNDEVIYPVFREDCLDAIKYLAKHRAEFSLNPQQIVLWGDTHGGLIASEIGVKYHNTFNEFKILGVISFYAPIDLHDFHKRQINKNKIIEVDGIPADERTFNAQGTKLLETLRELDLLKEINGSEPSFYLLHGRLDSHIPIEYTIRFADILKKKGVNCIVDLVEDGIHSIDFYGSEKYNSNILHFLSSILE